MDPSMDSKTTRDAQNWARGVTNLNLGEVPKGALDLGVNGRRLTGPLQGFGKMWQKTYEVVLTGEAATPQDVIREWKANFPKFWPKGNLFYGPLTGIAPGESALLNLAMPGRVKLSTGVLVMYADDESFTFMTPEGHMLAGWITFSAFRKYDATVAQARVLMRAHDPIVELGAALGGHRKENRFWEHTLKSLAAHLGVTDAPVGVDVVCVDKKRQWRNARNIWRSPVLVATKHLMGAPVRAIARPFKRSSTPVD